MRRTTLEFLCCPHCQGMLSLRHDRGESIVYDGLLLCSHCERGFPLESGIPQFISTHELQGLNRRFARFYDRFARFETIFDKLSFLPLGGARKARHEVLHRLAPGKGRVLEVSIGSGSNLPYLFESPGLSLIYGLDISPAQLSRCHKLAGKRGWPVELFLGMAEALPFKAETFDCVFHIGGINFFSEKKKAIREMIRVARPGCKIVIADEAERVARFIARLLRLSPANQDRPLDTSVPVHLVPETMEDLRVQGIWKRHGQDHGYCIEFRKPEALRE